MTAEGDDTGAQAAAEDAFSALSDETRLQILLEHLVGADLSCERCWLRYPTTLQVLVTSHPAVRGLYEEQGLDLSEALLGTLTTREQSVCRVELDETEPVSATATVELGGAWLELELDETADVVSLARQ